MINYVRGTSKDLAEIIIDYNKKDVKILNPNNRYEIKEKDLDFVPDIYLGRLACRSIEEVNDGGGSGGGVFCAPYENGTWSRVIELPVKGCDPGVAPDASFMVVADKDKPGGYGHFDLNLILRLPDGTWSNPRNLGPKVNSRYIEFGPRISPDKKYLFFNRSNGWDLRIDRMESDIYWVELKEYLPESYR